MESTWLTEQPELATVRTIGVRDYANGRHSLSVKLDNPSTQLLWTTVGTAILVSAAAVLLTLLTIVHGWRAPGMVLALSVSIVVWLGALTYTMIWWTRRFIAKAVKTMRKQLSKDLINVMNIKDVDRWMTMAGVAEPRLRAVPSGDRSGRS